MRAVKEFGATGGAAWSSGHDGGIDLIAQCGLGAERIDRIHETWTGHRQLLQQVFETGRPQMVQAHIGIRSGDGADAGGSQRPVTLLLTPLADGPEGPRRLIELFVVDDDRLPTVAARFQSLQEMCLATGAGRAGAACEQILDVIEFSAFCRRVHGDLALSASAEAIADGMRSWCRCDRVSVLERRGRQCRLLAVSDLSQFDPRAEAVRTAEQVAASVVAGESALWHAPQPRASGTPDAEGFNVELSLVPGWPMAAVPLASPAGGGVCGVLILEHFDTSADWDVATRRRVELAAPQAAAALAHALQFRDLPLSWLGRGLQRLGWRGPRTLPRLGIALVGTGIAIAALAVVKVDFEIKGRGALQPAQQRDVFAGVDGIVDQIHVRHGALVEARQPLIDLRSPDLERERRRLEGEIRTTRQQIADLGTLRVGTQDGGRREESTADQLAARQQELEATLGSLEAQLQGLTQHEQQLHRTSAIAGRVLTWDVEELLAGRPVRATQRLLTVADLEGQWNVEIDVSDRDIAHVRRALRADEPLRVSFVTATDVDTRHEARVTAVSHVVEHDAREGAIVTVTAALARTQDVELHPGATVYARIHCGRRPAGYVWFRRLYETAATWWAL
jgi:multidrug efflux pump subunit AcrA (membrane-fusion protein)